MSVSVTYESEYKLIVPYNETRTIAPISINGTVNKYEITNSIGLTINSSTGIITTPKNTDITETSMSSSVTVKVSNGSEQSTFTFKVSIYNINCSICNRDIYRYVNNDIIIVIAGAIEGYSGNWIFDSVSLQDLSYEIYNEEPWYELHIRGTVNSLKIIEVNFNIKYIPANVSNTFTINFHFVDPLVVSYNNTNCYKNDYISILPVIDQGIGIKYSNYRVYNNETGASTGYLSILKLSLNSNTGEIYGTSDVCGSWKIQANINDGVQTYKPEFILNIIDNHCTDCINCTNCFYCTNCKDCSNCTSCSNCIYCNDCTNVY